MESGTAASWAIDFYQRHGFVLVSPESKTRLLISRLTLSGSNPSLVRSLCRGLVAGATPDSAALFNGY
jgi:hypothetical protein